MSTNNQKRNFFSELKKQEPSEFQSQYFCLKLDILFWPKTLKGAGFFHWIFLLNSVHKLLLKLKDVSKWTFFFLRMNKLRYLNSFQKFSISNWSISYDIYRQKMLFSIVICNKMVWFSRNWEFIHCLFCQRLLLTAI